MKTIDRTMGPMEWALLLSLSMLWGGSFFFVGVAVKELEPLTIVALRVGLAAVALNALVLLRGQRMPLDLRLWAAFFGMGLLNNMIPFSLITWGQGHIASGLASILNATTPFFTLVIAHLLTRDEPLTPGRLLGVIIGFVGVVYMLGSEVNGGATSRSWAQLAVLAGALSYAFAGVFGRRFRRLGCSPLVAACGQVTASALVLMPLALGLERFWQSPFPGLSTWSAVAGLALFSTALAYLIYFRLLASAGATNLLLVTFLIPASAILLGIFVLGERLEWRHLAGMGLIGLGLVSIDGRPFTWLRSVAFAAVIRHGQRFETVQVLSQDPPLDERHALIQQRAVAIAYDAVVGVSLIGFIWEMAHGITGAFTLICFVGGITHMCATAILRRRL